jgi:3-(3-hydroxy-phenyl)propionate hydroxylase
MHQPHSQPRPSIYYPYQVHAPWLPSAHGPQERHPVVVVGGGPIGLVTAIELARHGVASVVLESELQVSEGSRAIVFTRRSMEILQQVGVTDRMLEHGLPWRFGNSFYRGQRVFRMEAPHDENDRFHPMTNLQQQYLEEYLVEVAQANPLIDLRWGNKVTQVLHNDDHVRVEVDTPEGPYVLQADWLVASDGARSPIRSQFGLKMEGASYEGRFVIADIRIDLDLPTERLAFFDPEWNPGNTVLMHREPHGIWRIDYQLPANETPEEALRPASLAERINAQLAMIGQAGTPWEMDWSSVYSARAMTLPEYVHGRVIFTGDAAHLLPIFGVRGANTGFQDAQNLGWKLACVHKGLAGEALLATYSSERVGASREICQEAGKSTRFMTPPTRGFRLLRDAVLSLSLTEAFVRPLYHWRTSRPHEYAQSPLNAALDDNARFTAGPAVGATLGNVRLGDQNHLLDHLGAAFVLLVFTASALPAEVLTTVQAWRARGVPLQVIAINATGHACAGADLTLADPQAACAQRYGVPTDGVLTDGPGPVAYLARPDQHVCARWLQLDAPALDAALQRALPQASHSRTRH